MDRQQLTTRLRSALAADAGPGYLALADQLRGLILDGRLLVGDRLPAERTLAADVGASRTTVTTALDLLRAEGLLASRQGSGTVVAPATDGPARPDEPAPSGGGRPIDIDLTIAAPSAPADLGPLALEAASRLPALLAGPGLHPLGLPDLRRAIARRLTSRGLRTSPDQVLVTQGALHAWDLILRAAVRPGELVGLEQPTYAGAADAARAHAVRLLPIGVDELGWSLPQRRSDPVLALVTADHHNPTGAHASDGQRRGIVRALPRTRLVVDETFGELDLDEELVAAPRTPLAAFDRAVTTVGSLSKLVWPGLRIGWVRAAPDVIARLGSMRSGQDLAAPVLDQLLGVAVFDQLDAIRADRQAMLRVRRDHLLRLVHDAGWTARRPAGGLVLWVDLGEHASSTRVALNARPMGVRINAGTRFSLSGTHDRYLRIPYSQAESVLSEAVRRLRVAADSPLRVTSENVPRWTA